VGFAKVCEGDLDCAQGVRDLFPIRFCDNRDFEAASNNFLKHNWLL
jgi:hypothetical protein